SCAKSTDNMDGASSIFIAAFHSFFPPPDYTPLTLFLLQPHSSIPRNASSRCSLAPIPSPPSRSMPASTSQAVQLSPKGNPSRWRKNPANRQTIPPSVSSPALHPPMSLRRSSPVSPASTISPAPARARAARSPVDRIPFSNNSPSSPTPQSAS